MVISFACILPLLTLTLNLPTKLYKSTSVEAPVTSKTPPALFILTFPEAD